MRKQHKEWLLQFLQNCKDANRSDYTIRNYNCDLQRYIKWYETHRKGILNHADAQTISAYQNYLTDGKNVPPEISKVKRFFKKLLFRRNSQQLLFDDYEENKKLGVSSRRRHLSAIKNFYEFLKQSNEDSNDLFPLNPVKSKLHSIRLKDEDVIPTKLLTKGDWKILERNTVNIRDRLVIHLLYYGGLRLSELSGLMISDFNFENRSLRFVRKGGDVHTLFIQRPKVIFDLVAAYLVTRPPQYQSSVYLFSNRRGKALSSRAMYNVIMKIFTRSAPLTAGITPHSFRKACASNLYDKTKDLLLVRDYLNHADAKVTQGYIERIGPQE